MPLKYLQKKRVNIIFPMLKISPKRNLIDGVSGVNIDRSHDITVTGRGDKFFARSFVDNKQLT